MRFDGLKVLFLNILCFSQRLENIPRADHVAVICIIIGQCSVAFDKIGRRAASIGRGGIILLHGLDIFQKHDMGKTYIFFAHRDGSR